MQIASGTYTGNGSSPRGITGVGFQPDAVMVKENYASRELYMRNSAMPANESTIFTNTSSPSTTAITSLDADGFTVNSTCNANGRTYYWIALKDNGAGDFAVGHYSGNGSSQSINCGFQGRFVLTSGDASWGCIGTEDMGAGAFYNFDGDDFASGGFTFDAEGFDVGDNASLNNSGEDYYYLCFGENCCDAVAYTGNDADDRDISVAFQADDFVITVGYYSIARYRFGIPDADDLSFKERDAAAANQIQEIKALAVEIGSNVGVNNSGYQYYMAILQGTTAGSTPVEIAGAIAAQAGVQGTLAVARKLVALISAQSEIQGALDIAKELTGAIDSAASLEAALRLSKRLAGTVIGQSVIQASIKAVMALAGTAAAQTDIQGTLSRTIKLAGAIAGQTSVIGGLTLGETLLAGIIAAQSTVQGALKVTQATAWKSPGTCANATRSGSIGDWPNPDNVKVSDDVYAMRALIGTGYTNWLQATNFGFTASDIPEGSVIVGIEAKIEKHADGYHKGKDDALYLRKSTGQTGDDKADIINWWPEEGDEYIYYSWGAGEIGSIDDSDVRSSSFGVDFSAYLYSLADAYARLDHFAIRVLYLPSPALAGIIATQSAVQGALKAGRRLAVSLAAQAAVAGALKVARELAGACSGQASIQAALRLSTVLSGTITGQSLIEGIVGIFKNMIGTIAAQSTVEGTLTTGKLLMGEVAAQTVIEGALKAGRKLTGMAAAQANLQGELSRTMKLAGAIAGQSSMAAELSTGEVFLAGIIAATSMIEGALIMDWALTGEMAAQAEIEGYLSFPGEGQRQSGMFLVV
jgi:hypothetical protein